MFSFVGEIPAAPRDLRRRLALPEAGTRVFLAKGSSALRVETLALEIRLADSTVEALRVPVLPQSLDPSVGGFDGEVAAVALGREELVPVLSAVLIPVFNVEASSADRSLAVEADEALGMPRLAHGVHAVVLD